MINMKAVIIGIILLVLFASGYIYFHPDEHYQSEAGLTYSEVKYATEMRHNGHSDIKMEVSRVGW